MKRGFVRELHERAAQFSGSELLQERFALPERQRSGFMHEAHARAAVDDGVTSWDREFSRREEGLPRSNAVVKWDGDVRIAIGWPRYGTPDLNNTEFPFKSTGIIESQVTTLSPELAELTGLKAA